MKYIRKNRLVDLLLHPALLALPVTLIVILALPDIFQKFEVKFIKESSIDSGRRKTYHDLDNDGVSESFTTKNNENSGSAVIIESRNSTIDQWNMKGVFNKKETQCVVGDYDNDGYDEIYPLVYHHDSLILYAIDFRKPGKFLLADFFVAPVQVDTNRTMRIYDGKLTDLNNDGYKELVFVHSSGFGLTPRKIFAVDIRNRIVNSSMEMRTYLLGATYADIDEDGNDEIFLRNYAASNYKIDSLPEMHDHAAYLLVLNHKLKLLFKPLAFPGNYNGCSAFPLKNRNGNSIVMITFLSHNSQKKALIQIIDLKGKVLNKKTFIAGKSDGVTLFLLKDKAGFDQICLNYINEKIVLLNPELEKIKELDFQVVIDRDYLYDPDQDGKDEIIAGTNKPGEFAIFRHNLSSPVYFSMIPIPARAFLNIIKNGKDKPGLMIQTDSRLSYFQYGINPLFYLQFPFYLVIYLVILFFILLIRNLQRIQLKKKFETEQKMASLQLLSLRNQMDPHFTFNVLNTIGSVILQNKSDESYDMLMKFSKMIRTTINSANKICRPLEEEVSFVKNYLELQQIRHEGYFNYQIEVEEGINTHQPVPKMILQTYVENSLKHGLVPRKTGGKLLISVRKEEKYIRLMVEDNGIGRQQAKINGTVSTGVGLSIISQYYDLLNRDNAQPITELFTDLKDSQGNAAGTRVLVCIPVDFVFPVI